MAANGDPANHSSASNKSVKKMKKRKELDALLTGSNGKTKHFNKPSNKPPKKDGHELLIPDESDSLDSSDNDFFATPKKTVIRKPRPWRICATCIPLCIFVLTLACIVVTTGLIWMHMDLKQDLDDMRERLAKVESDVQTSQTQAATVSSLESKLEKLQGLINSNQQALVQMKTLNQSINDLKTQVKTLKSSQSNTAASNELQLQQEVANMGHKVNELEDMKDTVKQLQDKMNEMSGSVESLESSMARLNDHPTPTPTLTSADQPLTKQPDEKAFPQPQHNRPSLARPEVHENSPEPTSVMYVRQELERFGLSLDNLNATMNTIRQSQQGLDARLTLLEAMGEGAEPPHEDNTVSITPQMMTVFTKIHHDVNTLMNWYNETQLHSPTDASKPTVSSPLAYLPDSIMSSEAHSQWEHYVNNTLMDIQSKMDSLSSDKPSTSTPSVNYTDVIKQAMDDFKDVYTRQMNNIENEQHSARLELNTLTNTLQNVQERFSWVYEKITELQHTGMQEDGHAMVKVTPSETPTPFFPLNGDQHDTTEPRNPLRNSAVTTNQQSVSHEHAMGTVPSYNPKPSEPTLPLNDTNTPVATKQTTSPVPNSNVTPGTKWHTAESTSKDKVTTQADKQTTGDGLEGPDWQVPLDIFHPTKPPTVVFPHVQTVEDLKKKFSLWDANGDGYVIYSDLPDFMGPFTPKEEDLMRFDADKDGRFDLEELLAAAGLS